MTFGMMSVLVFTLATMLATIQITTEMSTAKSPMILRSWLTTDKQGPQQEKTRKDFNNATECKRLHCTNGTDKWNKWNRLHCTNGTDKWNRLHCTNGTDCTVQRNRLHCTNVRLIETASTFTGNHNSKIVPSEQLDKSLLPYLIKTSSIV